VWHCQSLVLDLFRDAAFLRVPHKQSCLEWSSVEHRSVVSILLRDLVCDQDLAGVASLVVHDVVKKVAIQVPNERLAFRFDLQCIWQSLESVVSLARFGQVGGRDTID